MANSKIKITGEKLEQCNNDNFGKIMSDKTWPVKVSYWLGRIMDHVISELKVYYKKRDEIIDKYSLKYEADTEEVKENGKKHKAGDLILNENGNRTLNPETIKQMNEDIKELSEIEIELTVNKIEATFEDMEKWQEKGLNLSPDEMRIIMPFFEITEGHKKEK